jgi:hypothetical protein
MKNRNIAQLTALQKCNYQQVSVQRCYGSIKFKVIKQVTIVTLVSQAPKKIVATSPSNTGSAVIISIFFIPQTVL